MVHSAVLDLPHRVARRIASLRRRCGLTQDQLASRLEIAAKNVQRLESGRQNLTLQTIARVAAALNVPDGELLCGASDDGERGAADDAAADKG